jgi:hypothetical protein
MKDWLCSLCNEKIQVTSLAIALGKSSWPVAAMDRTALIQELLLNIPSNKILFSGKVKRDSIKATKLLDKESRKRHLQYFLCRRAINNSTFSISLQAHNLLGLQYTGLRKE